METFVFCRPFWTKLAGCAAGWRGARGVQLWRALGWFLWSQRRWPLRGLGWLQRLWLLMLAGRAATWRGTCRTRLRASRWSQWMQRLRSLPRFQPQRDAHGLRQSFRRLARARSGTRGAQRATSFAALSAALFAAALFVAPGDAFAAKGGISAPTAASGASSTANASDDSGALAHLSGAFDGWRHSGLTNEGERYVAAYPRPPVDRGAQRFRTLIEGQLKHVDAHARRPPTLVVNGNPTPLYTDKEGWFARPWAFGAGSNSVEIISADGKKRQRMQFYEADRTKPQAKLRAIVTWDDPHAQVDLHVITPTGLHAFFANPTLADGSGFDVDSVDGAGPGIFSSAAPERGTWLFFLNYWGNFDSTGYNFDAAAHERDVITALLTLVFNENTPNERRETFVVPLRKIGDLVLVKSERL